jgi:hypothetical protein
LRRAKAAFKVGAELLSPHPNQRPYGYFRLSCGHIVARQYHRFEASKDGDHQLGCVSCRERRYDQRARTFGWANEGVSKKLFFEYLNRFR